MRPLLPSEIALSHMSHHRCRLIVAFGFRARMDDLPHLTLGSVQSSSHGHRYQILEATIKYRWKTLPPEQCAGIKSFIVNLVIQRSSTEEEYRGNKLFMSKLNVILVQIVKQARLPACAQQSCKLLTRRASLSSRRGSVISPYSHPMTWVVDVFSPS